MGFKLMDQTGEVITLANLMDRDLEKCVLRPKVQKVYKADREGNILIEKNHRLSTLHYFENDYIIIDEKHEIAQVFSSKYFHTNYDILNSINTTSEC